MLIYTTTLLFQNSMHLSNSCVASCKRHNKDIIHRYISISISIYSEYMIYTIYSMYVILIQILVFIVKQL